jgi:hypothetical protein
VLLIGIGVDYGIHIKKRIDETHTECRVRDAINGISLALVLSAFTTSVAFLSNVSSSIRAVQEFGILSAIGICSSFLVMVFLTAADSRRPHAVLLEKIGGDAARTIKKREKAVALVAVLITIGMAHYATTIRAGFDISEWLPEELEITESLDYALNNFDFVQNEEAIIVLKEDCRAPATLVKMRGIENRIADNDFVVSPETSITSILSVMQDYATGGFDDPRYDEDFARLYDRYFENGLPRDTTTAEDLTAVYVALEHIAPDDVRQVLNVDASYGEGLIRIPSNTEKKEANVGVLYEQLKEDVGTTQAVITGRVVTGYVVMQEFRDSQIRSVSITVLFSFAILELIFFRRARSVAAGVIALLPVLLATIWIIGTMALLDIPLTITTITVAALAVGLGIDYSIHMTNRFMEKQDIVSAVSHTGAALLGSALTTIAAFGLLSFSFLPPLREFGIAIALSVGYSFIACVVVLPVVLDLWRSSPLFKQLAVTKGIQGRKPEN